LSAAVLYENMVVDANREQMIFPVVSIYPKEGTFWSDHPVGVVNRPWVTAEHEAAAAMYISYLMAAPQQQAALALGFRPGNVSVPVGAPIDAAHGADPQQPSTTLAVPEAPVVQAVLNLWKEKKKRSHVTLVMDCSGSMNDENKMVYAREGAQAMLKQLSDADTLSLLPFTDKVSGWAAKSLPIGQARTTLNTSIGSLYPQGGTALYDAVNAAYDQTTASQDPARITAIVVLSDGEDQHSQTKLADLLKKITASPEKPGLRIFTIGYGKGAKLDVLEKIATATQARSFSGNTADIGQVFREISTFF
jgi:Ca-activated chloride channel homolog